MNAIGLDPSLSGLALCCIRENGEVAETVLPKSEPSGEHVRGRMDRYRRHANNAVEWLRANAEPGLLFLEGYSYGSKGRSVLTLAEFGCYLRGVLLKCGYVPVEVPPAMLKKFATGKGNGDKAAVVSALASRYQRAFSNNDAADAYGLAMIAACAIGVREAQTAFQREVVDKAKQLMQKELAE